ncbi:hypothetical protein [Dietzia sp. SYD-A1]|uniref:hypothetical protein n=1 Tax=Dietzia sp. SYD-A1 TaxID=2780141 RepID=UPI001891ACA4|nr:hypothetical protein [Dietzia sp. SYD-A1]
MGMVIVGEVLVVVAVLGAVNVRFEVAVVVGAEVDERGEAAGSLGTVEVRDRDVMLDWPVVALLGSVGVVAAVGPASPSAPTLDSGGSAATAVASNSGKEAISGAVASEF